MPEVFRPQTLPPSWFVRPHIGSILNQILRPIHRFPERLKSVRIVAFAFCLYGSVPKVAYRRTQTFDGFVSNPEGFRQTMFQGFAIGIECLLGRWLNFSPEQ
jgi:hypothetical protein